MSTAREFLDEVWDVYGAYSATQLHNMLRTEGPWLDARADCDPSDACSHVISQEAMRDHYAKLLVDIA